MAKAKAMPEVLFIKREDAGTEEEWLSASEKAESHLETETTVTIGEYKLVAVRKGTLIAKFEK